MYLFQYFVDINGIAFLPLPFLLFVSLGDAFLGLAGLLHGFATRFRRHFRTVEGLLAYETTIQRSRSAQENDELLHETYIYLLAPVRARQSEGWKTTYWWGELSIGGRALSSRGIKGTALAGASHSLDFHEGRIYLFAK